MALGASYVHGTTSANPVWRLARRLGVRMCHAFGGYSGGWGLESAWFHGGVLVPLTAIMDVKGRAQAWVLDRATMTVQPRAVKVGPAHGDSLAILAGLKPGDTIVTAGIHLLRAGETVRIAEVPRS